MTIASVAMFRNQMRRDIRIMQAGHDPAGLCRDASVIIPTYCSDTVVCLSLETNWATDRKLMSKTGRQLADGAAYLSASGTLSATLVNGGSEQRARERQIATAQAILLAPWHQRIAMWKT